MESLAEHIDLHKGPEVVDFTGKTRFTSSTQVHIQSAKGNNFIGVIDSEKPPQEEEEFRVYLKQVNGERKHGWCHFGVCNGVVLGDGYVHFTSDEGFFTVRYLKQIS